MPGSTVSLRSGSGVEILQGRSAGNRCGRRRLARQQFRGHERRRLTNAIDDFYSGAAQEAIVERILREQFLGELPVGMATIVPMPSTRLPFVIAAPNDAGSRRRREITACLSGNAGRLSSPFTSTMQQQQQKKPYPRRCHTRLMYWRRENALLRLRTSDAGRL